MTWINLGFNGEEGYEKIRMHVGRVPVVGERFEFWNPDGGGADLNPTLDGNTFYVAEVGWVGHSEVGGPKAEATVLLEPKEDFLRHVG